ncbi:Not1 N-terminal domain, CCR4-Not complex component-domain-containing protein [Rhodotorula diobovata]|uniref:General negative regulator of transcription subunit n=1 Tax=Rhodotorula diobovata TaxID=5288 RepID=A0A5C5FRI3_9BASI|nr:Not1 N-terminal domain, CCR4-Not complex component-domain-containing protein [Rhodotorula diobovata]
MAARKLQTEIDKTLKKVAEGVELFEGIFDKIQASSNQTQKEKLEQDLKTQIKKLQRLRDQIKTWMASNDIKDKQPLIDNRKLIETQMERFKACEKEMKTKAFSKEGLNAAAKLDPKEQQKVEMCQWIQSMVEELSRQVEQAEAEVETIQGTKQKKKDAEREARLEELERLNERREWHVNRLELILRLLENGNLSTDSVGNVKDDIAYFVESNTEEDFEEDEGIYDELNLEDEEDAFGMIPDDHHSSHESASVADEPAPPVPPIPKTPAKNTPAAQSKDKDDDQKTPAKAKASAAATPQKKPSLDSSSSSSRPPAAAPTPSRSVSGPASSAAARAATAASSPAPALPPIRYAAAAAAANASAGGAPPGLAAPPAASAPSPAGSAPAATAPEAAAAAGASQASSAAASPALAAPSAPSPSLSPAPASSSADATSPAPAPAAASADSSATDDQQARTAAQQQQQQAKAEAQQARQAAEARLPSSLADLVTSFESAKQKSMRRDQDLGEINKILEAGMANVPQPLDAEKPKYYVPRNPYATPTYYPQEPSSQFASPALFAKLDVDTLFYIFYYCPGTYLQYLAANELKKQSWRFHKQYLTWFQRANEPTTITDSYEQGVYLYFDWEGSWCQRKKNDFRFDYAHLEQ